MRRRKYSDEYRNYRKHSPNLNPLEQIARTALELQKLIGVDYFDVNHSKDDYFPSTTQDYDEYEGKYYSLCISKLPHRLSDYDIRDIIYRECDCFGGDFNVKISTYNGQRVAYINFRSSRDATKARGFLRDFRIDSKSVHIEPVLQKNRSPKTNRSRSPVHYYNNHSSSNNNINNSNDNYDNYSHRKYYDHLDDNQSNSRYNSTNNYSRHRSRSNSPANYKQRRNEHSSSNNNNSNNYNNNKQSFNNSKDPGSIPTRTLFVGNLPPDVTDSELRKLFNKFGNLTDIDIKKSSSSSGSNNRQNNSYAFIKFENLEIANEAKQQMSGKMLRKFQLKIGFGKVNPTNCVWVGGLGPWILYDSFEKEMSRFGSVKQINWPQNKNYAYVLYDSVDIAITAVNNLRRGYCFDGDDKNRTSIKVDFADSSCMVNNEPVGSNSSRRDKKSLTSSNSSSYEEGNLCIKSAKSISQLIICLNDVWTGMIVLKNNNFGCRLYMLKGEKSLVNEFISENSDANNDSSNSISNQVANLTITQRMKLDPHKLTEMSQRIESAGENGFCLLLASAYLIDNKLITDSQQPQRPLKNLITYLRTKESAGVIFLKSNKKSGSSNHNNGVLHAFPPCEFSYDILSDRAPNLTKDFLRDDYLVILLIRNSTS